LGSVDFRDPTRSVAPGRRAQLVALARLAAQRALPVPWSLRLGMWRVRLGFALGLSRRLPTKAFLRPLLPPTVDEGELERLTALSRATRQLGAHTYGPVHRRSREWLLHALRPEGLEHLEEARASGRGVIMLGTHAGLNAWIGPILLQLGYPLRLMQRATVSAEILLLLRRDRIVSQVLPFPGHQGAGIHLKMLHDLLKSGAWVQHVGDYPDSVKGLEGTYLGSPVRCVRSPWALGALTGAVLVGALLLVDADLEPRLHVATPICVNGAGVGAMEAALQAYLDFVSRAVAPLPWNLDLFHWGRLLSSR